METKEIKANCAESSEATFVALEVETNEVLAKGFDADTVISQAQETGKDYIFSYVPEENQMYIF